MYSPNVGNILLDRRDIRLGFNQDETVEKLIHGQTQMQGSQVSQPNLAMREDQQSSVIQTVNQQGLQPQTYYPQYQQKDQIDTTNTGAPLCHQQLNQLSHLTTDPLQHNTFQSQAPTTTTSTIQGNFQNVLNLQRQQLADGAIAAQQQEIQKLQQQNVKPQSVAQQQPYLASATSSHSGNAFGHEFNQCATNATSTATSTSTSSSGKSQVRVCINRLNVEDARLMQQSIKKFVQKSPELARNMGLLQESANKQNKDSQRTMPLSEYPSVGEPEIVANDASVTQSSASVDMFTAIKADEKRTGTKRKLAISLGDIPPEQICMSRYWFIFQNIKLNFKF